MGIESRFQVNVRFNAISLPPVKDILVLGRKHPQGKTGVMESFRFIAPDEFEMFDVPDDSVVVEAVMINRRILQRMSKEQVLTVLRAHVFPFVAQGEAVKVDFDVTMEISGIVVQGEA